MRIVCQLELGTKYIETRLFHVHLHPRNNQRSILALYTLLQNDCTILRLPQKVGKIEIFRSKSFQNLAIANTLRDIMPQNKLNSVGLKGSQEMAHLKLNKVYRVHLLRSSLFKARLKTHLFRPPDIVCRRTYILPVFLLSFLFFRCLISVVAERNNENRPHGRK